MSSVNPAKRPRTEAPNAAIAKCRGLMATIPRMDLDQMAKIPAGERKGHAIVAINCLREHEKDVNDLLNSDSDLITDLGVEVSLWRDLVQTERDGLEAVKQTCDADWASAPTELAETEVDRPSLPDEEKQAGINAECVKLVSDAQLYADRTFGLMMTGLKGKYERAGAEAGILRQLVQQETLPGAELDLQDSWGTLVRAGALPGSADWTHEYGDAANTLMSQDQLVKAPLRVERRDRECRTTSSCDGARLIIAIVSRVVWTLHTESINHTTSGVDCPDRRAC